jgi:hypothetical protein
LKNNIPYVEETKIINDDKLSKWAGEPEYEKVTRLEMTCCGGAGSSCWYKYVRRVGSLPPNSIIRLIQHDGKPIWINTAYIVEAEDFTLVTAKLDVSKRNRIVKSSIEIKRFLTDDDKEIEFIDDVADDKVF